MSFSRVIAFSFITRAILGSAAANSNGSCSQALTQPYYPASANCWEFEVPVTVTSENIVLKFPDWKDHYALQDFLTDVTSRPGANRPSAIVGTKNETASYTIAASFCTPKKPGKKTIILATHGIGQARSHWNSAREPEKYNFVQHAISKGYSVWFYDRLGCGQSEKYALPLSSCQTQLTNTEYPASLTNSASKKPSSSSSRSLSNPDNILAHSGSPTSSP